MTEVGTEEAAVAAVAVDLVTATMAVTAEEAVWEAAR